MDQVDEPLLKKMPELRGLPLYRAEKILQSLDLPAPHIKLETHDKPRWQVLDQSPATGILLPPDPTIRLSVQDENPVRLLPEVFQEDDESEYDSEGTERPAHLLAGFLLLIQQILGGIERRIDHLDEVFSPDDAPETLLPWLAQLFPLEIDPSWSPTMLRSVLRRAPELLRARGTAPGLEVMIELYTGVKTVVHENAWPHRGIVIGQARIQREVCVSTIPSTDHAFYVEYPAMAPTSAEFLQHLLKVIDREKPAHLRCCVLRSTDSDYQHSHNGTIIVGNTNIGSPSASSIRPTPLSQEATGESEL